MVNQTELETEARFLEHTADGLVMLSRSLRGKSRAFAEGQARGFRSAAAQIRRLEDRAVNDTADFFADQDLGEMKERASARPDYVDMVEREDIGTDQEPEWSKAYTQILEGDAGQF